MPLTIDSVAQDVKQATSLRHSEAEKILLPQLSRLQSWSGYATLLRAFYGFYYPVMQNIRSLIDVNDLADLNSRRTTDSILIDLEVLGESDQSVDFCTDLPVLRTRADAFGALYVLEGSTLGGRMIRKMLLQKEGLDLPQDALQFFGGYGEQTGSMWTSFIDALNEEEDREAIKEAANETFLTFENWMKRSLHHD